MKPKSYKKIKEGIAEEVGVHQSVVDDFISFYFGKVRKALSNLDFPRVQVDSLGTFILRKSKLDKSIKKNKSILGNLKKRTYSGFAKREDIHKNIQQMEAAMKQIEQDILNKKEFKNGKKLV